LGSACVALCAPLLICTAAHASNGGGGGSSPFFQMEPLVVNLAPPDVKRFLQVSVAIEAKDPALSQTLKDYGPILRSRTILILSSKSLDEVRSLEGKQRIMDELLDMTRLTLPDVPKDPTKGITDVHLTGFVVQ